MCQGAGRLTVAAELQEKIKALAVKKRINLVNIIELQGMGQARDEKISAFITRLNGKAELCDYNVECPSCKTDISYKEQTIMYQLVKLYKVEKCLVKLCEVVYSFVKLCIVV